MRRSYKGFDALAAGYDLTETPTCDTTFFTDNMPAARDEALDIGCGSGIVTVEPGLRRTRHSGSINRHSGLRARRV